MHSLPVAGAFVLEDARHQDERGHFARIFCAREFALAGLDPLVCQANLSFSRRRGTLRGLHLQRPPYQEMKIVRCLRGAVFDVLVDARPASESYGQWCSVDLRGGDGKAVYLPAGIAHGFQALSDDSELLYLMGSPYVPAAATGYRFDDPFLAIPWPLPPEALSARDLALPPFAP